MFRPRIIPVLLLKNEGLVKTIQFGKERYIGDPINAVKIFNDLHADELIFLDILASREKRTVSIEFIKHIGEEANMPFAVGGGIKTISQIREIIGAGAEKVVINTEANRNINFIRDAAEKFGSSTIVVCIDVKKNLFGKYKVVSSTGERPQIGDPLEYAKEIEKAGAGEIIIQSVDRDGAMIGYDLVLLKSISTNVSVPVVALGGAGAFQDFEKAIFVGKVSAVAAGSLFVYHGRRNAVLINYPSLKEKASLKYE